MRESHFGFDLDLPDDCVSSKMDYYFRPCDFCLLRCHIGQSRGLTSLNVPHRRDFILLWHLQKMLMLMGHMPIVVSPCCISLWQVSWRRLVFLEPQSIFN